MVKILSIFVAFLENMDFTWAQNNSPKINVLLVNISATIQDLITIKKSYKCKVQPKNL